MNWHTLTVSWKIITAVTVFNVRKVFIISAFVITLSALIYIYTRPNDYYTEMIIKRNNPGNIRNLKDSSGSLIPWRGSDYLTAPLESFLTFDTLVNGYRAMIKDIHTKVSNGFNTIEKIIYRYAPPSENPTEDYVKFVSDSSGIYRTTVINPNDWQTLGSIAFSMSIFEGNISGQPKDEILSYVNSAVESLNT